MSSLQGRQGLPGVWVETYQPPTRYSERQINHALDIAWALRRGRFLLLEPPEGQ